MSRKGRSSTRETAAPETNSRNCSTPCSRATRVPVGRASKYGKGRCSRWRITFSPSTASMRAPVCRIRYWRSQLMPLVKSMNTTRATPSTMSVLSEWWAMTLSMITWVNKGVASPTSWIARLASSTSRQMLLWRRSSGTNQAKPKGLRSGVLASGCAAAWPGEFASMVPPSSVIGGSASAASSSTGAQRALRASTAMVSGWGWPGRTQAEVCSPCCSTSAGVRTGDGAVASTGVSAALVAEGGWGAGSATNTTAGSGTADQSCSGQGASPAFSFREESASISAAKSTGGARRWRTSSASKGRR